MEGLFPDWVTESRVAIAISLASAAFTAGSLLYTRRLAINDSIRMRRKTPVFEVSADSLPEKPEWLRVHVVARNLEPVAVDITGYRHKGKAVVLVDPDRIMAPTPFGIGPDFGALTDELGGSAISVRRGIGAGGAQETRSASPHARGATVHLTVYAKGPFRRDLFTVDWQWADGARR